MFAKQNEIFLSELEDFMRKVKKLSETSIKAYLKRIRHLLETQYSVSDLCGTADRLWEDYGPRGQRYDPADHGNTRAAIRHVDDLVRTQLLERAGNLYVCYEQGWTSFRPKGKYESGYTINGGSITFSYNNGFLKSKDVTKRISTTNLREVINLFDRAYRKGYFSASNTCISTIHGNQNKYDYAYADVSGNNCSCLFEGDAAYVDQLCKSYGDLLRKIRS